MVKSVEVKNFKSISDLKIDLGRVNIFIGENGSGKSNILEAVAFGAASSADKLDKEFLVSRGMRVPEPKLMRSAFSKANLEKDIFISFDVQNEIGKESPTKISYDLKNDNQEFSKWEDSYRIASREISKILLAFFEALPESELESLLLSKLKIAVDGDSDNGLVEKVHSIKNIIPIIKKRRPDFEVKEIVEDEFSGDSDKNPLDITKSHSYINKYKIYAPENTFLRRFEDEEAADPLGIRGEGLFKLLRYFQHKEDKNEINIIREALSALDWFDDFKVPLTIDPAERKVNISDRFIDKDIFLTQNSANEGFLFILFYISLFVSEDAPSFFAIDNLDASFNPKLCKHITQTLIQTAKKTNKQALFTTHNPFILDGLDLTDDEQRLFVVERTLEGHTIAKRIMPNDRKMKLSEQWMNGFLGGLPENF